MGLHEENHPTPRAVAAASTIEPFLGDEDSGCSALRGGTARLGMLAAASMAGAPTTPGVTSRRCRDVNGQNGSVCRSGGGVPGPCRVAPVASIGGVTLHITPTPLAAPAADAATQEEWPLPAGNPEVIEAFLEAAREILAGEVEATPEYDATIYPSSLRFVF